MRITNIVTSLGAKIFAALGVATVLAMGPVPTTRAQELKVIHIGSSTVSFSAFSTYYAAERGFFKREGFDPKMVVIKTEAAIAALNSGDLDYTTFSTSTIDAALRGFPVRLLAVIVQQPVMGLVVQKEITKIADLRGKKVGVSSFGGLTYDAAVEVFKHHGLDPQKDVTLLAAGGNSSRIAALKTKALDGAFVSAPFDIRASRQGFKVLLESGTIFKFPYGGFSATVAKIREKPAEVEKA
ncbi:MAG: ABC transporter substrate-binding protein, partial [Gammaproteobacteria bacterium]